MNGCVPGSELGALCKGPWTIDGNPGPEGPPSAVGSALFLGSLSVVVDDVGVP